MKPKDCISMQTFRQLPGLLLFPGRVAASKPTSEDFYALIKYYVFILSLIIYINTILYSVLNSFYGPYKMIWAVSLLTKDLLI